MKEKTMRTPEQIAEDRARFTNELKDRLTEGSVVYASAAPQKSGTAHVQLWSVKNGDVENITRKAMYAFGLEPKDYGISVGGSGFNKADHVVGNLGGRLGLKLESNTDVGREGPASRVADAAIRLTKTLMQDIGASLLVSSAGNVSYGGKDVTGEIAVLAGKSYGYGQELGKGLVSDLTKADVSGVMKALGAEQSKERVAQAENTKKALSQGQDRGR